MADFKDFDLLHVPLEGAGLIEASAGTGKSFSIAGLFLRLVLEHRMPVHEILVVTFTQAATEELRVRIRRTLRDAQEAFAGGSPRDAFVRGLLDREEDRAKACSLLNTALRDFDRAAVMTIHGFCWRVLKENAFESLSMFDAELVTGQELIKSEVVDDFWRKHLYTETGLFVQYALQNGFRPETLTALLGNRVGRPFLKVIPATGPVDASGEERAWTAAFETLRSAWPSVRGEVGEALLNADGLKRNCYNKEKVPAWMASMDAFLSNPHAASKLFAGFEKFTSSEHCRIVKKGCAPPAHPFFEMCDDLVRTHESLLRLYEQKLMGLKAELFRFAAAELAARKKKRNILYYDDLLLNLLQALQGKAGEELGRAIHTKYRAALIDEFQDTDPLQYAIFKEAFGGRPGVLFLIGDPKQSIYGFRGADLFAYMEAARGIRKRFTLRENWRSAPGLVKAVNLLFEGRPCPFVYEDIRFHPCLPAPGGPTEVLSIDSQPQPGFRFWVMEPHEPDPAKGIPKTEARKAISLAAAGEIARLLRLGGEGRGLLGGRPIAEEDIAVLVRKNKEAVQIQQVLAGFRIPSVLYGTGNLFDSHEAMEVERVLSAIAAPENGRLLKAALATDILGLGAEDLEELVLREKPWNEWVVRFKQYQDLWITRGFMRMFRQFLSRERVLSRIMKFHDGERRCTNLLHLAELLHKTGLDRRLSGSGLIQWLSTRRAGAAMEPEEHPIRLESDEKAVKLVTVHKSKGLEYPIVFCPFSWEGSRLRNSQEPFTFHAENTPSSLFLDLGSEHAEENRKKAEEEILSENLRLLYVSLTRAKAGCTLVWGPFHEAETSAPAYLLYPPSRHHSEGVVESTRKACQEAEKDFTGRLRGLQDRAGGDIAIEPLPTLEGDPQAPRAEGEKTLSCRTFRGNIDREQGFASFSSLVSMQGGAADPFDHDRFEVTAPAAVPEEQASGFFSFPAGMRSGSLLHDLFENLEFTGRDPDCTRGIVRDILLRYGYAPAWEDEVCRMAEKVLQVALDPADPGLRLSEIDREDRLHEVEFYWPLKRVTAAELAGALTDHGVEVPSEFAERIGRLEFAPLRGFMRGFMDLLFRYRGRYYLVDWKSNDLGKRVEDYGPVELGLAMQKGYYVLQYLIYTVAVHQFLKLRHRGYRYEDHFGGVFYIFLRGVDPSRGSDFGIYRARPSEDLVRDLAAVLIEGEE
jgi:exodeoxyribonuclease V beta subunit